MQYSINAQLQNREYDQALEAAQRYVAHVPKDPHAHYVLGMALTYSGRIEDALTSLTQSRKLYPGRLPPYAHWIYRTVYSLLDRDEEALRILKEATTRAPNYLTNQIILAIVYSKSGYDAEAQATVKEILRISPTYEAEHLRKRNPFKDTAVTEGFIAALRKAGLP